MGWMVQLSNSGKSKRYYLKKKVQTDRGAHPASYSIDAGIPSLG